MGFWETTGSTILAGIILLFIGLMTESLLAWKKRLGEKKKDESFEEMVERLRGNPFWRIRVFLEYRIWIPLKRLIRRLRGSP